MQSLVRDRHDIAALVTGRETLTVALRDRPDGLVTFGLGGPEIGVGRAQFTPFFTAAREAGLHSVPHAGETTGPATVWSAALLAEIG